MKSLQEESNLAFSFNYLNTPAKLALKAEGLGFGYDPQNPLFKDITFALEMGKTIC